MRTALGQSGACHPQAGPGCNRAEGRRLEGGEQRHHIASSVLCRYRVRLANSLFQCRLHCLCLLSCSGYLSFYLRIVSSELIIDMPPKKEEAPKAKPLWGRPNNTLKMGIVGMPNVGKSTTFNFLSKLHIPAMNYPFCTVDPNVARVPVPDPRFDKLVQIHKPKSEVSAFLSITDIAGLVRGASKGEGLGNAFLSHIREVDGIYHVVRAFDNQDIIHVEMDVNPIRDMEIICSELCIKDLEYCEARLEDCSRKINRHNEKVAHQEKALMERVKALLLANKWIRTAEWSADDIQNLNKHLFLTAKPVVYLVNLSQEDFLNKKNKWLGKIKKWVDENMPGDLIPYSADFETALLEAPKEETKEETEDQKRTMLPRIIKAGYACLDLVYYFTAGPDEVKCWTVRRNTKAPQAAGIIHTDFEKGFICAEVMKYDDFIQLGSEAACRTEGKYRQQGKQYLVEDGDIIFFRFNVGKSK